MLTERLKKLRKEAGLTQNDLAKKIGTSQQNIGFWETGRQKPKHEALSKLASLFNVSIDYLLGNTDIKNPTTMDIDPEDLKESLRTKSLGYNGQPPTEEEVENMANAFLEYLANRKDS